MPLPIFWQMSGVSYLYVTPENHECGSVACASAIDLAVRRERLPTNSALNAVSAAQKLSAMLSRPSFSVARAKLGRALIRATHSTHRG